MLRKIGVLIALSLSINLLFGNTGTLPDSFITGTNRATLEDSVDYLLHLASVNMDLYPAHAFANASQAHTIAEQLNRPDRMAVASKFMGEAKLILEDFYQAKQYLTDALEHVDEEMPKWLGDIHYLLAKANYYLAEYEESNFHYREAIRLFQQTNNNRKLANAYQNLGLLYHQLNDLDRAFHYYDKSLGINQSIGNDTNTAGIYQNLGLIHYRNGNFEEALNYFEKSVYIYRALADSQNIGTTFSNVGLIHLQKQEHQKAFENFEKSYLIFDKCDYKMGKMWAQHNMGTSQLLQMEFKEAEKNYLGSLELAEKLKCPEGIMSNLNALAELMEQTGRFEEAYYYFADYSALKDSINSLTSHEKITELETLYNVQAQKEALAKSELTIRKHRSQQLFFLIVLILITAIAVFIYLAYRKKKFEKLRIHSSKLDLENVLLEKNRALEEQITETQEAVESDRLKSAFLANMSHELRTPMNAIIAFSNFLREPDLPEQKKEEYLDHITSAGDSLLQLIDDIIDIAKLESKQLKISIGPVNISRMLRELKKVFLKLKSKNNYTANLVLTIDKYHDYIVNTDVLRIKQILNNLIDNAFKYTKRGVVEFGVTHNEEGLLFFVRDTGIGIPEEKLEKIFDRFHQIDSELNRQYGGTGLGLAISRNLAELLGGKMWVESEVGKGSAFFVQIPANNFRMVEVSFDPASTNQIIDENNYNWKSKTILIAEDEDLNYKVLDSCLKKTKARIIRAEDGETAVKICEKEKVDLVLMDIQMPQMDGFEATRKIKDINSSLPVIAQTSFAMANEKDRCIDVGCDDYITKPLDLEKLLAIIEKHFQE